MAELFTLFYALLVIHMLPNLLHHLLVDPNLTKPVEDAGRVWVKNLISAFSISYYKEQIKMLFINYSTKFSEIS